MTMNCKHIQSQWPWWQKTPRRHQ